MTPALRRVGFIGLGNQGGPIARHIIDRSGLDVALWARRPEALEAYAGTSATFVDTAAELGSSCDEVGVCVWDDEGVEDVLLSDRGVFAGMQPGGIVAIHSTVSPATVARMGKLGAERGIIVLDAPVSGGPEQVRVGKMLVMVGGDADAAAACRPVFATFGDPVVHVGELGSGALAKLMNNALLAAFMGAAQQILELGEGLGLDRDGLVDVLLAGSAVRSETMGLQTSQEIAAATAPGAPKLPHVSFDWARKDVGLAIDALRAAGVATDRHVLALALETAARLEQRLASS